MKAPFKEIMGKDFRIIRDGDVALSTPNVPRHLPGSIYFEGTLEALRALFKSMDDTEPEYILYALALYLITVDGRAATYEITYD